MKSIQEAFRGIIEHRILPWIERDGISKLLLPEQITSADCARRTKYKQPCNVWHREHELGIGLTGKAPYCIEGKTFIFTPGKIVFLPGGTAHGPAQTRRWLTEEIDFNQPALVLWIRIYSSIAWIQVTHIIDRSGSVEGSQPCVLLDRHFDRLITSLLEEVRSCPLNYDRIGRHLLLEFLERCVRAAIAGATNVLTIPSPRRSTSLHSTPLRAGTTGKRTKAAAKPLPQRVLAAREFIHSNYHIPISLNDIAAAAETSASYLIGQFKSAVGMPPVRYLLAVRMETAGQLLLTDMKISEVGRMVGIESPSYFSRLFRQFHGIGPAQYRRKMSKSAKRRTNPRNPQK